MVCQLTRERLSSKIDVSLVLLEEHQTHIHRAGRALAGLAGR